MASTSGRDDAALIEGQLSWLVHILGAITQGRMSNNLGESQVSTARSHVCQVRALQEGFGAGEPAKSFGAASTVAHFSSRFRHT